MYNKKLMVILFSSLVTIAGLGLIVWLKGDVLLFAVTNSAQVRDEKSDWNAYIQNYGREAIASPKE